MLPSEKSALLDTKCNLKGIVTSKMSPCRWAMSSLTLKGKPSDHAPVASVSTDATPTPSIASSGMANDYSLVKFDLSMHITLVL